MGSWIAVFIGGGLGSMARYALSRWIVGRLDGINPVATFLANLLATVVLGFLLYWVSQKGNFSGTQKLFWATGFCGGFSTFSTFSYETLELMRSGNQAFALANVLVSLALALFALYLISRFV